MGMNHADLVKAAKKWLVGRQCAVIATEFATSGSETPDAVGWKNNGECLVIECKSSRQDFFANKYKQHEVLGQAIGDYRYFLTPSKLVTPEELPEGWGLVYCIEPPRGPYCRVKVEAPKREPDALVERLEKKMLIRMAWRSLESVRLLKPFTIGDQSTGYGVDD